MKKVILEFIKERLATKGKNFTNYKSQSSKDSWFRYFFKEGEKDHIITLIENTDAAKLKWYKASHFDGSMNKNDKNRILTDSPIEKAVSEYFPQSFEIGGRNWLLRWS